jgi:uncharacterized protein
MTIETKLAQSLRVEEWQIKNTLELHEQGSSIPFIARYRKERTGGLTDVQLIELFKLYQQETELEKRKTAILKSLEEQNITDAVLLQKIKEVDNMARLEDLYLPYRPKRKTRASIAKAKGLEPLAKLLMSERVHHLFETANRFVKPEAGVESVEDALQGARDIAAEWMSETEWVRERLRRMFQRDARLISKVIKGKEEEAEKYASWFDWDELARKAPSHRILAMFRAEKEGFLRVKVQPSFEEAFEYFSKSLIRSNGDASGQKGLALKDALKRLLFPAMESELRQVLKQKADEAAIKVFAENLRQLLLAPPLGMKNVLAIDPGFRTGCKVVCLDKNGKLLHNETIYPHPPQSQSTAAMKKLKSLVNAYQIEAISIGNGTAGRETENLIKHTHFDRDVIAVMVNEDGASVYSASENARKEFPQYDITVRGAVSIGRRLQDPLAEMVKIDPKSMGVGQYQHDVNQNLLKESLQTVVELCVNAVGVELNSASRELLTYVSGIGPVLAERIIEYRNEHGDFKSREELKKVKGMGAKAFQQSAGFLRIKNAENPLDASAVHPENYALVKKMADRLGLKVGEMVRNPEVRKKIDLKIFITEQVGLPTLNDILDELEKPGRDPRKQYKLFQFDETIRSIDDLKSGMILPGVVTNVTEFGAFVNLGIKENGLIHKSQIANEFVQNPSDYLSVNQQLRVKVLEVDKARKRIGLSLRDVD